MTSNARQLTSAHSGPFRPGLIVVAAIVLALGAMATFLPMPRTEAEPASPQAAASQLGVESASGDSYQRDPSVPDARTVFKDRETSLDEPVPTF